MIGTMPTLTTYHTEHAQDFIALAGGKWPRRYRSLPEEYAAAQNAAVLDRSFLGKVHVSGKDREPLLHRLTTNEIRKMAVGESRVSIFTNAKGRIVDLVEMLAQENNYLLLTSPGRAATVSKWIDKYTFIEDVTSNDATAEYALFSLLGAQAMARARECFACDLSNLPAGNFLQARWRGAEILLHHPQAASVARLNVIAAAQAAVDLWRELLAHFTPVGLEVYEILRIAQGVPAADHEIVEDYNPHEIGLLPFVNFEKGCYIGQEVIARLDSYQKVQRQLIGLQCAAAPESVMGAAIFAGAQEIGKVTSAARAIAGEHTLALAVIRRSFAQPELRVDVHTSNGPAVAVLKNLPFAGKADQ